MVPSPDDVSAGERAALRGFFRQHIPWSRSFSACPARQGRPLPGLLGLRKRSHVPQVPKPLAMIETVADGEHVLDLEPRVLDRDLLVPGAVLNEESTDLNRGGGMTLAEKLDPLRQRVPGSGRSSMRRDSGRGGRSAAGGGAVCQKLR